MNWREELRKEAEQLHKENEFYSFSATQIQQDKEYFGRFGGQELATKHQETYKRYKHLKWNLLGVSLPFYRRGYTDRYYH